MRFLNCSGCPFTDYAGNTSIGKTVKFCAPRCSVPPARLPAVRPARLGAPPLLHLARRSSFLPPPPPPSRRGYTDTAGRRHTGGRSAHHRGGPEPPCPPPAQPRIPPRLLHHPPGPRRGGRGPAQRGPLAAAARRGRAGSGSGLCSARLCSARLGSALRGAVRLQQRRRAPSPRRSAAASPLPERPHGHQNRQGGVQGGVQPRQGRCHRGELGDV